MESESEKIRREIKILEGQISQQRAAGVEDSDPILSADIAHLMDLKGDIASPEHVH